jgi:hypothetical protein
MRCSPDGYFLRAYKIKSVLSVHAQMIFKILGFLVPEKKKYKAGTSFLKRVIRKSFRISIIDFKEASSNLSFDLTH